MVAPQIDIVRENGGYVEALRSSVLHGSSGLDDMPNLVIEVITNNRWQRFYNRAMHKELEFSSFKEFAESQNGLSSSVEMLKRMCSDNPQAMDALDKAMQGKAGGANNPWGREGKPQSPPINGVIHPIDSGEESRDRSDKIRRRLRKDFPEVYAQVLDGGKTLNEAAIETGVYPRRVSVSLSNPLSAAKSIITNAPDDFVSELIEALEAHRG